MPSVPSNPSTFANAPAPVRSGDASTYAGFYLRNNLASTGAVPAVPPFNVCPDIIQSAESIDQPGVALSSLASWQTFYNTAPDFGSNFYYLRGLNGDSTAFAGTFSLYWAPAQLIMFPSTWKNNPLSTAAGKETVAVTAESGHIGVGSTAFVFNNSGQIPPGADTFYAFVAQNTAVAVPEISSWLDMSQLMTQQLNFGFRNMVSFDATSGSMLYRLGINVPMSVGQSGVVQLSISATGFAPDDTVAFIGDCFTAEMKSIALQPMKVGTGPYVAGLQLSLDPGFASSLAVQYWNTSGTVPAPGSTITLSVNYVVPDSQLEQAFQLNVLDSKYSLQMAKLGLSAQPQQVAPIGSVSFVVAPTAGGG